MATVVPAGVPLSELVVARGVGGGVKRPMEARSLMMQFSAMVRGP